VWASPKIVEAWTVRSRQARDSKEVRSGVREGAVRIVRKTKKPLAAIVRDLGVNPGTLGNWVDEDWAARGEADVLGMADEAAR